MKKNKIWIVTEMFYPDEVSTGYVMTKIADALSEDAEVHIICGPIGYENLIAKEKAIQSNFTIHRVNTLSFNKNNLAGRLARLIILSVGMFIKGLFYVRKDDHVLIVTNPAFIVPCYALIKLLKKNKLTILVHDVFPENALVSKIIKSSSDLKYKIALKLFNWGYSQADRLIVVGIDMLEVLKKKTKINQDIKVVQNWADIDAIKPTSFYNNSLIIENKLSGKIVFTFAGNIGRVQGLEKLFITINKVKNEFVHFLFVGNGALVDNLKKYVDENNIKSVTFVGSMPRSTQNIFLNAAHFGLVTLDTDLYGLGVPSKSYNIMAAGKPILFIGNKNSEIASMIKENNCGYSFEDEDELLYFFNNLSIADLEDAAKKGQKARLLAETEYSREAILTKIKAAVL